MGGASGEVTVSPSGAELAARDRRAALEGRTGAAPGFRPEVWRRAGPWAEGARRSTHLQGPPGAGCCSDDLVLTPDGRGATLHGSQGQQRAVVLALTVADENLRAALGRPALLLAAAASPRSGLERGGAQGRPREAAPRDAAAMKRGHRAASSHGILPAPARARWVGTSRRAGLALAGILG